jgi:uncharacterized protein YacL
MKISLNFLVRLAGMFGLGYLGFRIGIALSGGPPTEIEILATQLLTLAGAGLGLLTTHRWTVEPVRDLIRHMRSVSIAELTALVFGALVGLIFAVLLSVPLAQLPPPFGQFAPIIVAGTLAYLGAMIFSSRKKDIADLLLASRRGTFSWSQQVGDAIQPQRRYLVDTSAIVDGRIAAVAQTGFIEGTLLVPNFVLHELQSLADSGRGLEILNTMQKQMHNTVEVLNVEAPGTMEVDEKLIILARQYRCPVITNDHNLGRVAELQGVKVLSLNQLADAVRPPVIPGQDLRVTIRDIGREREQGISFLEDGTMVVVEDARRLIGREVDTIVTRVYQTQTGRIVFAQLRLEQVAKG